MDSWNRLAENGTSHIHCRHQDWTDGEATHRSVVSKRSPFTQVHNKGNRWLLLLWASCSCSRCRSGSTNSSSKTIGGRTTLRSTTASSPRKVHPWKLLKRGGNVVELCLISYFCMYQELYYARYINNSMSSYTACVCVCSKCQIPIPLRGLSMAWWIVLCHLY